MDCDGMIELARRFAERLFAEYPEWEPYAKVVWSDWLEAKTLEVRVPQEGSDRVLQVDIHDEDEITIAFDLWHTHVEWLKWREGFDAEEIAMDALRVIRSFVSEEMVVKVVRKNGAFDMSTIDYVAAFGDRARRAFTSLGTLQSVPALREGVPRETITILSWRHTYDKVIEQN